MMCGKLFCTKPKITTNLQYNVDCYLDDNIEYSTLYTIENKENQTPGLVKDFTSCGRNKVSLFYILLK